MEWARRGLREMIGRHLNPDDDRAVSDFLANNGEVRALFGRRRYLPNICSSNPAQVPAIRVHRASQSECWNRQYVGRVQEHALTCDITAARFYHTAT
jgi:hypothetical protein